MGRKSPPVGPRRRESPPTGGENGRVAGRWRALWQPMRAAIVLRAGALRRASATEVASHRADYNRRKRESRWATEGTPERGAVAGLSSRECGASFAGGRISGASPESQPVADPGYSAPDPGHSVQTPATVRRPRLQQKTQTRAADCRAARGDERSGLQPAEPGGGG